MTSPILCCITPQSRSIWDFLNFEFNNRFGFRKGLGTTFYIKVHILSIHDSFSSRPILKRIFEILANKVLLFFDSFMLICFSIFLCSLKTQSLIFIYAQLRPQNSTTTITITPLQIKLESLSLNISLFMFIHSTVLFSIILEHFHFAPRVKRRECVFVSI